MRQGRHVPYVARGARVGAEPEATGHLPLDIKVSKLSGDLYVYMCEGSMCVCTIFLKM